MEDDTPWIQRHAVATAWFEDLRDRLCAAFIYSFHLVCELVGTFDKRRCIGSQRRIVNGY